MRKPLFTKKASFLLASTLVFSVLFTAIVYACSGLNLLPMNTHLSSMSGEGVKRGPCAEHKQDICKSVRDRMLSVQLSVSKAEASQQVLVLPLLPSVETVKQAVFSPAPFELQISYHPVFKLSLPFSYLVLRI